MIRIEWFGKIISINSSLFIHSYPDAFIGYQNLAQHIMKHILFLVAIAMLGLVSSCKKDEKTEPTPQERIIGKWKASKALIGSTNALSVSASAKTELEVEFTQDGKVIFTWQNYNLTTNPPTLIETDLNGVYSWNGNQFTITVKNGADTRTVIGSMAVTATTFVFTGTSGDITTFISLLEATKL